MTTAKLSSKGQIAIPKMIRQHLGLQEGAQLSLTVRGRDLILRKVKAESWRSWRGVLKGTRALQEHEREHRDEVAGDAESS